MAEFAAEPDAEAAASAAPAPHDPLREPPQDPPQPPGAPPAAAADPGSSRWVAALMLFVITGLSIWIALNPAFIAQFRQWGYLGAFLISLIASASIILPIPGLPVAIALGTSLNPVLLGVVTGVGSAIGETSGYLAGYSGRTLVAEGQMKHYVRLEAWTRKYGAFAIFAVAVTPFPFFDLAGIAAGAIRMPFWQFFVATALGKTIKYIIAILLGAGAFRGIEHWIR